MNVSLTPELERFVASELETGLYQTASEVIRAGLRRLKQEKERLPTGPQTADELDEALLRSIRRLDRGQGAGGERVSRRLRQRKEAHRSRG
jgi:antitoxin ParD1/3/4